MRVMLLSLPKINESSNGQFPLGIGYLISSLKNAHEVIAYHFSDSILAGKEIYEKVKSFKPDIVGLTCNTFNRGAVRATIRQLKSIDKGIKIVVGGVHASFCYDQMIEQYGADIVVMGEGERTFPELCSILEKNGLLESVKGIAYKEKDKIVITPSREPIMNLDELPMPDHSYAQFFMEKLGMGFIITSRGCPVRCTFCSTSSFWGQRVRMNSVTRVVDEMEMLVKKFGVKKIYFYDDTFNLGVDRVKAICEEIKKRNLKVEWACQCRVVPVTEEMIARMVDAGCRHICWGIESGSEEILKRIEKRILLSQIHNAFELSSKFSGVMSTGAFTMVGNQGESEKTIQDTVNFLNTIPITDSPSTAILCVLPGTMLYEGLKNKGHIRNEEWLKRDSIPMYTLENSFEVLNKWRKMVANSGKRIPFDPQKHFWHGIIETSDSEQKENIYLLIAKKFLRAMINPKKIVSKIKVYLPTRKHISWR